MWRRILHLYAPYRIFCFVALLSILTAASISAVSPQLIKFILDRALPQHSIALLALGVSGLGLIALVVGLLGVLQNRSAAIVGEKVLAHLRIVLLNHMLDVPLNFYQTAKQGAILTRVGTDVDDIENIVLISATTIVQRLIELIISATMLAVIDLKLFGVALCILCFDAAAAYCNSTRVQRFRREARTRRDNLESIRQEIFGVRGALLMKSLNAERYEEARYGHEVEALAASEVAFAVNARALMSVAQGIRIVGLAVIWLVGTSEIFAGRLSLGSLVAFTMYFSVFYAAAELTMDVSTQLQSIKVLFSRVFEYLDVPAQKSYGTTALPERPLEAYFDGVTVTYGRRVALSIDHLRIVSGEAVAIVGASGAGKTTLLNLLLRLIECSNGDISVGGIRLEDISEDSFRSAVVAITQNPTMLDLTLRDNLTYGLTNHNDSDLEAALRRTGLGELLDGLPKGLDTKVGPEGCRLSDGERQRISVARAMLRKPRILICDEISSALDADNERKVFAALSAVREGVTLLLAAHRYVNLGFVDKIIVLERGRIVEIGTADQLITQGGIFAAQYAQQVGCFGTPCSPGTEA